MTALIPRDAVTWAGPVVPSRILWAEVERLVRPRILADMRNSGLNTHMVGKFALDADRLWPKGLNSTQADADETGWFDLLTERLAARAGATATADSYKRRLFGIKRAESVACRVDLADAIFITVGLRMDYDTIVPTFPGKMGDAIEMVQVRRPNATDDEVRRLAGKLIDYRNRVLYPNGWVPSKHTAAAKKRKKAKAMAVAA